MSHQKKLIGWKQIELLAPRATVRQLSRHGLVRLDKTAGGLACVLEAELRRALEIDAAASHAIFEGGLRRNKTGRPSRFEALAAWCRQHPGVALSSQRPARRALPAQTELF